MCSKRFLYAALFKGSKPSGSWNRGSFTRLLHAGNALSESASESQNITVATMSHIFQQSLDGPHLKGDVHVMLAG